jgi:trans-2,3-dihydro-3-hydroxyanthranilate isomerase
VRSFQVDVFGAAPFSGNGVGVFPEAGGLSTGQMQRLTQELRQFECIFLEPVGESSCTARIFTVEEELPFAGHPVLGAGAVLHALREPGDETRHRLLLSGGRPVEVRSRRAGDGFSAEMEQGTATFGPPGVASEDEILAALGLGRGDLAPALPLQLVSTGLPYLIVPVARGLDRARIGHPNFEALLARHGAKFVYVLDVEATEGRTWDNAGAVEDVATGSAAGPAAAYLVAHGRARAGSWQRFRQGRFAGRPSELLARVAPSGEVTVGGSAFLVGEMRWARLPE